MRKTDADERDDAPAPRRSRRTVTAAAGSRAGTPPAVIPPSVTPTADSGALTPEPCDLGDLLVDAACLCLRVPENRAWEGSPTMDLVAIVLRSPGSNPAPDPLFYLEGDPGGVLSPVAHRCPLTARPSPPGSLPPFAPALAP